MKAHLVVFAAFATTQIVAKSIAEVNVSQRIYEWIQVGTGYGEQMTHQKYCTEVFRAGYTIAEKPVRVEKLKRRPRNYERTHQTKAHFHQLLNKIFKFKPKVYKFKTRFLFKTLL